MNLQTVNANLSRVPFFRFLNFEVQSLDNLHAAAEMTFESRHIGNPVMEHYHGGIIASFMEAIAAIAVRPDFEEAPAKPINLTVDYLRPAVEGAAVYPCKCYPQRKAHRERQCDQLADGPGETDRGRAVPLPAGLIAMMAITVLLLVPRKQRHPCRRPPQKEA